MMVLVAKEREINKINDLLFGDQCELPKAFRNLKLEIVSVSDE
jgi:hypothetical protein